MSTKPNQVIGGMFDRIGMRPSFPLIFDLRPTDASFLSRASCAFDNRARIAASPARVFDEFVRVAHGRAWLDNFLSIDWLTPQAPPEDRVFVETFTFMSLRSRTLVAEPGKRWVAATESCSLPLAREMVQEATFEATPEGATEFHWRVAYDPSDLLSPANPLLRLPFERLFRKSTYQLAAYCSSLQAG